MIYCVSPNFEAVQLLCFQLLTWSRSVIIWNHVFISLTLFNLQTWKRCYSAVLWRIARWLVFDCCNFSKQGTIFKRIAKNNLDRMWSEIARESVPGSWCKTACQSHQYRQRGNLSTGGGRHRFSGRGRIGSISRTNNLLTCGRVTWCIFADRNVPQHRTANQENDCGEVKRRHEGHG